MWIYRLLLVGFLFFTSVMCGYSQQIENVAFSVKDNFIIVNYDIVNSPSRKLYDIQLKIINNNKTIKPRAVTGDLKNVSPGKNKKIEWDVLRDEQTLIGKLQVEVEIEYTRSTKIIGGPTNAFLSMLMPGVGNYFVNTDGDSRWYYVTGSFLCSAIFTFTSKSASDKFYKVYHDATIQTDIDEAYKSANDNYQYYQFFLGLTGAIWLGDVIYVTIKGFKNRSRQVSRFSQKKRKINFYFVTAPNNFQIGFVKRY